MYTFDKCKFTYKRNDKFGMLFSQGKNSDFYIKSKFSSELSVGNNTSVRLVKSFLSEEVDYSSELEDIKSNSTLSEDYSVKNVLLDNLDYWASNFTRGENCRGATIQISLKEITVLKSLSLFWVKPPNSVVFSFCEEEGKCEIKSEITNFPQLRTRLPAIFIKTKFVKIEMRFNQSGRGSQCFCSITRITMTKNEISLNTYEKEETEIATEYSKNSNSKRRDSFTDNFLPIQIDDDTFASESQLEKVFEQSSTDVKDITTLQIAIQRDYTGHNSQFNQLHSNLTYLNNVYTTDVKDFTYSLLLLERELNKLVDLKQDVKDKNQTQSQNQKRKRNYAQTILTFLGIKSFFSNIDISNREMSAYFNNALSAISKMKIGLNKFISEYGLHFQELYVDQYVREAMHTVDTIKQAYSSLNVIDQIYNLKSKLPLLDSSIKSLKDHSTVDMNTKLELLTRQYSNLFQAKELEYDAYIKTFEVVTQNVKLIKLNLKRVFVNISSECRAVNLVTNSSYGDLYVKLFIKFNRNNKNEFDIFFFKFVSKDILFYLKYRGHQIEVWKKKYEKEERIILYDKCTSVYDSNDQVEDFSKLFFILAKIVEGRLTILLSVDYHQPPEEIETYLEGLNNADYSKLVNLHEQNENEFNNYFSNSTLILDRFDEDLKLMGNFAIDSPRNVTRILMAGGYPKPEVGEEMITPTLQSNYPYNFFSNLDSFTKVLVDNYILNLVSLDPTWKILDSGFSVFDNFYVKYEVNLDRIFGESRYDTNNMQDNMNSVYLIMASKQSLSSYFFEIVKVGDGFIFKLFQLYKKEARNNIYRKKITQTGNIALILVKNKHSLLVHIQSKSNSLLKSVFTIPDFHFVKFSFLVKPDNYSSVNSIYFSDTLGGNFSKDEIKTQPNYKNKCSTEKFRQYKCKIKDENICTRLFCKSCCSKKLRKTNHFQYESCFDTCHKLI